jgi:hypothetical protein
MTNKHGEDSMQSTQATFNEIHGTAVRISNPIQKVPYLLIGGSVEPA